MLSCHDIDVNLEGPSFGCLTINRIVFHCILTMGIKFAEMVVILVIKTVNSIEKENER